MGEGGFIYIMMYIYIYRIMYVYILPRAARRCRRARACPPPPAGGAPPSCYVLRWRVGGWVCGRLLVYVCTIDGRALSLSLSRRVNVCMCMHILSTLTLLNHNNPKPQLN